MAGKIDPTKFGEGRNVFGEYLLQELYKEVDGFISKFSGKVPEEKYEELNKANGGYKSTLKKGLDSMKEPVETIEKLLKKAKSGEIKNEDDAKALGSEIDKQYTIIAQLTAGMYQLLDPQIDAYNGIIKFYIMDVNDEGGKMAIKGLDKKLFLKGCEIIKKYFLEEEIIEQIKSQAQTRHQEALPQAA